MILLAVFKHTAKRNEKGPYISYRRIYFLIKTDDITILAFQYIEEKIKSHI